MRRAATGAIGGLAVLVALFLPWYEADFSAIPGGERVRELAAELDVSASLTGWEAFDALDILLALCALAAVVAVPLARRARPTAASLQATAGGVALAIGIWKVLDPPGGADAAIDVGAGAWLALAGGIVALANAVALAREPAAA